MKDSDAEMTEGEPNADGGQEEENASFAHGLVQLRVTNFPQDATGSSIRKVFQRYGPVDSVTILGSYALVTMQSNIADQVILVTHRMKNLELRVEKFYSTKHSTQSRGDCDTQSTRLSLGGKDLTDPPSEPASRASHRGSSVSSAVAKKLSVEPSAASAGGGLTTHSKVNTHADEVFSGGSSGTVGSKSKSSAANISPHPTGVSGKKRNSTSGDTRGERSLTPPRLRTAETGVATGDGGGGIMNSNMAVAAADGVGMSSSSTMAAAVGWLETSNSPAAFGASSMEVQDGMEVDIPDSKMPAAAAGGKVVEVKDGMEVDIPDSKMPAAAAGGKVVEVKDGTEVDMSDSKMPAAAAAAGGKSNSMKGILSEKKNEGIGVMATLSSLMSQLTPSKQQLGDSVMGGVEAGLNNYMRLSGDSPTTTVKKLGDIFAPLKTILGGKGGDAGGGGCPPIESFNTNIPPMPGVFHKYEYKPDQADQARFNPDDYKHLDGYSQERKTQLHSLHYLVHQHVKQYPLRLLVALGQEIEWKQIVNCDTIREISDLIDSTISVYRGKSWNTLHPTCLGYADPSFQKWNFSARYFRDNTSTGNGGIRGVHRPTLMLFFDEEERRFVRIVPFGNSHFRHQFPNHPDFKNHPPEVIRMPGVPGSAQSASSSTAATALSSPAPAAAAAPNVSSSSDYPSEVVNKLEELGYSSDNVELCLRAADGDAEVAAIFLADGIPPGLLDAFGHKPYAGINDERVGLSPPSHPAIFDHPTGERTGTVRGRQGYARDRIYWGNADVDGFKGENEAADKHISIGKDYVYHYKHEYENEDGGYGGDLSEVKTRPGIVVSGIKKVYQRALSLGGIQVDDMDLSDEDEHPNVATVSGTCIKSDWTDNRNPTESDLLRQGLIKSWISSRFKKSRAFFGGSYDVNTPQAKPVQDYEKEIGATQCMERKLFVNKHDLNALGDKACRMEGLEPNQVEYDPHSTEPHHIFNHRRLYSPQPPGNEARLSEHLSTETGTSQLIEETISAGFHATTLNPIDNQMCPISQSFYQKKSKSSSWKKESRVQKRLLKKLNGRIGILPPKDFDHDFKPSHIQTKPESRTSKNGKLAREGDDVYMGVDAGESVNLSIGHDDRKKIYDNFVHYPTTTLLVFRPCDLREASLRQCMGKAGKKKYTGCERIVGCGHALTPIAMFLVDRNFGYGLKNCTVTKFYDDFQYCKHKVWEFNTHDLPFDYVPPVFTGKVGDSSDESEDGL